MTLYRWILLIFFLLGGCAEIDHSRPNDEGIQDKLINGTLTSIRPEIGKLSLNGSYCTGTLIRPRVVISAAHCVSYRTSTGRWGRFIISSQGKSFEYSIDGVYSFGRQLGDKDVTLLHLATPVPNQVALPTQIAPAEPTEGNVTIFGYGCSNRRTGAGPFRKQLYTHSFDQNSNQLCPGDSGGPVVIGTTGAIFKINSGYYTNGQGDIFGRPSKYYRELSAYANVMNIGGLSQLQRFIRDGGITQEGGEAFIGGEQRGDDEGPPEVALRSPEDQSRHLENSTIEIEAYATDDVGLAQVELVWDFNGISYPCPTDQQYVSCTKEADGRLLWKVKVGEGERRFHVRAMDLFGKESVTESRTLFLVNELEDLVDLDELNTDPPQDDPSQDDPSQDDPSQNTPPQDDPSQNTPPQDGPPQVRIISPQNGHQQAPYTEVEIIAEVQNSTALNQVYLAWGYNQENYPCPTQQRYADCSVNGSSYHWTVRLTDPGERPFHIEAIDQNGARGQSREHTIHVQAVVDQSAPEIEILAPELNSLQYAHTEIEIIAQVSDDVGVDQVYLQWDFNSNHYPCPHRSQYVDCDVYGSQYQWSVRVNEGERSFRVQAIDQAGNESVSEDRSFELLIE